MPVIVERDTSRSAETERELDQAADAVNTLSAGEEDPGGSDMIAEIGGIVVHCTAALCSAISDLASAIRERAA